MLLLGARESRFPSAREWEQAARDIERLPSSAFKELPASIAEQLEARSCTIPQAAGILKPHNVIRGEFGRKGQKNWAVLCSKGGKSSVLIFWGKQTSCATELALGKDSNWLQTWEPGIVYSRRIAPVGADYIMAHHKWCGGPAPPPIEHQGIDDAFVGKASVVHYCYEGKWLELQGAD